MTTKELIRREIERRKVDALDKGFTFVPTALQDLLSFLDTLPDEPVTDCHDLTEAAEKSARQYYVDGGYSPFPNIETASHIAGFKAGAEWQRKHDELLSKITEEHLEGLRWIIRTGITTQPRPYHKYCKDLLQLLESYKNEI